MKLKKYNELSVELSNMNKVIFLETNNDEEHIGLGYINYLLGLESCNNDFKELLRNNLTKVEIKKYYVPIYSIKCMVNDDYHIAFNEEGHAIVHVVCGENETRVDEESVAKIQKEEIVRFEGDYHFCCSEYKGQFANDLIHLDLSSYSSKNHIDESVDILDKFISPNALNKLVDEKVKTAFKNQGSEQAKKYILSKHLDGEFVSIEQNTKVIDIEKAIYLVPIYAISVKYNDEEYTSYICGVDTLKEYDYPRSKEYLDYFKKAKKNYLWKTVATYLLFILIPALGICTSLYLKNNLKIEESHFSIISVVLGILAIFLIIGYTMKHKKIKEHQERLIDKFEKAKEKPKSAFFASLLTILIIDLICLVGSVVLLLI